MADLPTVRLMQMSPGNKVQHFLAQEGSDNENQPITSIGKNLYRMKFKCNLLDTQGVIRVSLCFPLEEALAKPFVLSAGGQC